MSEIKPRQASDNLCKHLAEVYPTQLIEWLFGFKVGKVEVLKTELLREPLRVDSLILLVGDDKIFHIEFQTTVKSNPPIDFRMLDYYVTLKRKFLDKKIKQVLIVLKKTGDKIPDRYEDEGWFFPFDVVKLWEEDGQELLRYEGLFTLASLCGTKHEGTKQLKEIAKKVNVIKNKDEQREALRLAQAFAGLRFTQKVIYQTLRGMDMLEESVIVQDWIQIGLRKGLEQGLEQGKQEGLKQGKKEGLTQGKQEGLEQGERVIVTRLLTKRFGKLSSKTKKQIESLSLKQIESLGIALLDFKDKAELVKWLDKHTR